MAHHKRIREAGLRRRAKERAEVTLALLQSEPPLEEANEDRFIYREVRVEQRRTVVFVVCIDAHEIILDCSLGFRLYCAALGQGINADLLVEVVNVLHRTVVGRGLRHDIECVNRPARLEETDLFVCCLHSGAQEIILLRSGDQRYLLLRGGHPRPLGAIAIRRDFSATCLKRPQCSATRMESPSIVLVQHDRPLIFVHGNLLDDRLARDRYFDVFNFDVRLRPRLRCRRWRLRCSRLRDRIHRIHRIHCRSLLGLLRLCLHLGDERLRALLSHLLQLLHCFLLLIAPVGDGRASIRILRCVRHIGTQTIHELRLLLQDSHMAGVDRDHLEAPSGVASPFLAHVRQGAVVLDWRDGHEGTIQECDVWVLARHSWERRCSVLRRCESEHIRKHLAPCYGITLVLGRQRSSSRE
mmetsp:Transcript_5800/g.11611  ORF Transcript_5800/g.11611 Transcript_5800/m.11611 type:complete len:412 (-) Transcript_5800:548-1783(-)